MEVSNLMQLSENRRLRPFFEHLQTQFQALIEKYQDSATLVHHFLFIPLGLADSALATESENGVLLLTDDFPLYAALEKRRRDVVNFNHLRQFYLMR